VNQIVAIDHRNTVELTGYCAAGLSPEGRKAIEATTTQQRDRRHPHPHARRDKPEAVGLGNIAMHERSANQVPTVIPTQYHAAACTFVTAHTGDW